MTTRETAVRGVDNRKPVPLAQAGRGRVAILTADKVEDVEFFYPYHRFVEEGYDVDVITPAGGLLSGYRGTTLQDTLPLADADPQAYDALYMPGGLAPEELVANDAAVEFVRTFAERDKPIGSVCHGPRVLAKAGLATGRAMTGFYHVESDIADAGGTYVDEPVVADGRIVTSRRPGDLPQEMAVILERLHAA
ncbi:DJ-1/PfpI family protein [Amycolatopsis sp. DSM 110486]|uniref:DJ-1/PfpI family protein n=1 Tax=Amycolatopsis sp. DSM 110486 TaxID=2865832 RepID=UPI001C69F616|nr:DJ-1/PfpI family protein [Amycolatopsis sp. DSM 110486]QYN21639.1 DJ-1/PfpI family protein [Amycolatopsis sp. DSM 110486]